MLSHFVCERVSDTYYLKEQSPCLYGHHFYVVNVHFAYFTEKNKTKTPPVLPPLPLLLLLLALVHDVSPPPTPHFAFFCLFSLTFSSLFFFFFFFTPVHFLRLFLARG